MYCVKLSCNFMMSSAIIDFSQFYLNMQSYKSPGNHYIVIENIRSCERQFRWSFSVKRILLPLSLDCPANDIKLIVLFKEPRFRSYFKLLTLDSQSAVEDSTN